MSKLSFDSFIKIQRK